MKKKILFLVSVFVCAAFLSPMCSDTACGDEQESRDLKEQIELLKKKLETQQQIDALNKKLKEGEKEKKKPLKAVKKEIKKPLRIQEIQAETIKMEEPRLLKIIKDILKSPHGIDIDKAGNIYVADVLNKKVIVFDKDGGGPVKNIGERKLDMPWGVCVSGEILYVTDVAAHDVKVFDTKGSYLFSFGNKGSGQGDFIRPYDIASDNNGNLYVVDSGNSRIVVLDKKGNYRYQFGSKGQRDGYFSFPTAIEIDEEGNLYVVDTLNSRIQIFSSDGTFLSKFGVVGSEASDFISPKGVAVGDLIYVSDSDNSAVKVFDKSQKFVGIIDRISKRDFLSSPTYIKKSGSRLYVVDTDKVYMLEVLFSRYVERAVIKEGISAGAAVENEKTGSDGTTPPVTDADREIDPSLAP
ncbi:NHL repeat-containing protein [bacterium]|nr:NHL repeat-containing protein [bacterium]